MKRIHILLHEPYETPGCIQTWIREKGYTSSATALYADEILPDIESVDWLIVMGGSMSVHDTDVYPWLSAEKHFIKEAVDRGKAVIGICLGSQLVAEVLGGSVRKNEFKEIGWLPVRKNPVKIDSSLLSKFNETETVFHWHGDTFSIPPGAVSVFSSEGCANQCYIYRKRVIGLQFHLEVTEELLEGMIKNGTDEMVNGRYIQDEALIRNGACNIARNNELMYSILDTMDKL